MRVINNVTETVKDDLTVTIGLPFVRRPFDLKLPQNKPLSLGTLSEEQFNAEIEKGLAELTAGQVVSADSVTDRMQQDYGI